MKTSSLRKLSRRIAVPLAFALLLTLALTAAAFAQPPGNNPPGSNPPANNPPANNPPANNPPANNPPANNPPANNPPANNPPANNPPANNPPANNPPGNTPPGSSPGGPTGNPNGPSVDPPGGATETTHPSAPFEPPANCIVNHAATPAQLCPVAGGLQYYFIGADGSSSGGPWLDSFTELAGLYTAGASVSLFSGSNSLTGKQVDIHYLPSDQKLRISTYYPDTQYDTDKPYVFTVDTGNTINHEAW